MPDTHLILRADNYPFSNMSRLRRTLAMFESDWSLHRGYVPYTIATYVYVVWIVYRCRSIPIQYLGYTYPMIDSRDKTDMADVAKTSQLILCKSAPGRDQQHATWIDMYIQESNTTCLSLIVPVHSFTGRCPCVM